MNVKSLIKMLSAYDPKAEVRVHDLREPGVTLPATVVDEIQNNSEIFGFGRAVNKTKRKKKSIIIA
jgi:hypothetical protein